ncbi:hypothetical protein [Parvularcula dongshanensis]|uniref:Uncharacterized protein n=1 Tax=Parvularcula dongshanensis TaxID=1173995 RepID=A0A840I185_9PROT|nr:hypothetical protein [Parvularcula dongshanensis]MBB4657850.1 hypothetical protein [Parvularcula dongshanensis]
MASSRPQGATSKLIDPPFPDSRLYRLKTEPTTAWDALSALSHLPPRAVTPETDAREGFPMNEIDRAVAEVTTAEARTVDGARFKLDTWSLQASSEEVASPEGQLVVSARRDLDRLTRP